MNTRQPEQVDPRQVDDERVRRVEILISNILRTGVAASLCLIVAGIILMFVHHPEFLSSSDALLRLTEVNGVFPRTLADVIAGAMDFSGQAIATLGLLVLIATPVLRVAVSIGTFFYQNDRKFVIITSIVLALLLLSFVLGKVEG